MYRENEEKNVDGQWMRWVDEVQMGILRITRYKDENSRADKLEWKRKEEHWRP